MNLFEVKNASFAYDERILFKDLNFSLNEGEILAILGENGVGKTTLLKCLLNFLPFKSGACYIKDKNIKNFKEKELFKYLAYVPQAKNHHIHLSVLDMVVLGLNTQIHIKPKKADYALALSLLRDLKLEHLAQHSCAKLSTGQLQMVIFARALINKAQIIILDEPEANLDFKNQALILKMLSKLKEQGKALIFNTHFPQNALNLADKILIMSKNKHFLGDKKLINKAKLCEIFELEPSFFDYLKI